MFHEIKIFKNHEVIYSCPYSEEVDFLIKDNYIAIVINDVPKAIFTTISFDKILVE